MKSINGIILLIVLACISSSALASYSDHRIQGKVWCGSTGLGGGVLLSRYRKKFTVYQTTGTLPPFRVTSIKSDHKTSISYIASNGYSVTLSDAGDKVTLGGEDIDLSGGCVQD